MTAKVRGYIRNPTTGDGESGVTVTLKKHVDDSTVTSDSSAVSGLYEMLNDTVGYPGPVYEEMTVGATTRIRSGEVWGQIGGLVWLADIPDVFESFGTGVLKNVGSELAVSAVGDDMTSDIAAGAAFIKDGCIYVLEATTALTHDASDVSWPRIDRVILRLTREGEAEQGKIALVLLKGTAVATPAVAPSLTQTSALWEISLAQVLVDAGVAVVASNKVTDERSYAFFGTTEGTFAEGDHTHGSTYQPLDADLTALAALSTTGVVARTAANTYVPRTITGTASEITVTNGDGVAGAPTISLPTGISATKIGGGNVSSTEFDFLNGVTSAIQTQFDAKQAASAVLDEYAAVNPTAAGLALLDDANAAAQLATLGITATATELNYTDGVTSAIQTQIDAKAAKASPTFTGTLTAGDIVADDLTIDGPLTIADNNPAITITGSGASVRICTGTGSPEGVVSAGVGSIYLRDNAGAGNTFWVKEGGGSGNTGWNAK